jgi:hypothetical protein
MNGIITATTTTLIVYLVSSSLEDQPSPLVFFGVYYSLFVLICIGWSLGIGSMYQYIVLSGFTYSLYSAISRYPGFGIFVGICVLAFHISLTHRSTASNFNTYKTLILDWIIIMFLIPFLGFSDILAGTQIFIPFLGYFFGANVFSLLVAKICQQCWNSFLHPNEEVFTFITKFTIGKSVWAHLSLYTFAPMISLAFATSLILSVGMSIKWLSFWTMFAIGAYSSLLSFLIPVTLGPTAALTPEEITRISDSGN